MKTLVESIFGDNISTSPNITTMSDALDATTGILEKRFNLKCIDSIKLKPNDFSNKNYRELLDKWKLVKLYDQPVNGDISMFIVYLQFNKKVKSKLNENDIIVSPRIFVKVHEDNNKVILYEVCVDLSVDSEWAGSVDEVGEHLVQHAKLKDPNFNTNTKGVLNFITECMSNFKKGVDGGDWDDVFKSAETHSIIPGNAATKYILTKKFNRIVK